MFIALSAFLIHYLSSIGECLSIDHENQLIILSFPVFEQAIEQDFKYLNKHCILSLPKGRVMSIDGHLAYK